MLALNYIMPCPSCTLRIFVSLVKKLSKNTRNTKETDDKKKKILQRCNTLTKSKKLIRKTLNIPQRARRTQFRKGETF